MRQEIQIESILVPKKFKMKREEMIVLPATKYSWDYINNKLNCGLRIIVSKERAEEISIKSTSRKLLAPGGQNFYCVERAVYSHFIYEHLSYLELSIQKIAAVLHGYHDRVSIRNMRLESTQKNIMRLETDQEVIEKELIGSGRVLDISRKEYPGIFIDLTAIFFYYDKTSLHLPDGTIITIDYKWSR